MSHRLTRARSQVVIPYRVRTEREERANTIQIAFFNLSCVFIFLVTTSEPISDIC